VLVDVVRRQASGRGLRADATADAAADLAPDLSPHAHSDNTSSFAGADTAPHTRADNT
jgi:hypothetical protein